MQLGFVYFIYIVGWLLILESLTLDPVKLSNEWDEYTDLLVWPTKSWLYDE